jgi:hypothetical protein
MRAWRAGDGIAVGRIVVLAMNLAHDESLLQSLDQLAGMIVIQARVHDRNSAALAVGRSCRVIGFRRRLGTAADSHASYVDL